MEAMSWNPAALWQGKAWHRFGSAPWKMRIEEVGTQLVPGSHIVQPDGPTRKDSSPS